MWSVRSGGSNRSAIARVCLVWQSESTRKPARSSASDSTSIWYRSSKSEHIAMIARSMSAVVGIASSSQVLMSVIAASWFRRSSSRSIETTSPPSSTPGKEK